MRWQLVSHPYYTRYADVGDSTGFRHIDLNIPELLESGRGANVVQTAVSLDDEWAGGCTVIVPGFHNKIREWWGRVVSRGQATNGRTHRVDRIYNDEDKRRYKDFEAVVCGRGDLRMTMGQIIHGSTGRCDRVRRVVFPWLTGVSDDGVNLEMTETCSWEEVSRAHRDMVGIRLEPSGQQHKFGIGRERFGGCVEMRGICALGDALVGCRRWDSREVLMEREAVLGPDDEKAWEYVGEVRSELKSRWKRCFWLIVRAEGLEFGENSYFRSLEGLATVSKIKSVGGVRNGL